MHKIIDRFFQLPDMSFFLLGPRGTGKSLWLQHSLTDSLTIDLLNPEQLRTYTSYPEKLIEVVSSSNKKTVIIDEIQKVPELLSVVHSLIEQKLGVRFILTGSSARKLKRSGVNLLAGRAIMRHMHPFMAAELKEKFSLVNALNFGLIPLVVAGALPEDMLNAYVGLYLQEEVQAEGMVRNIGNFSRFLEVMSFSHASVLNVSNIARECMVSRKLIEGYLSVLEDLLLSFSLSVFTKRAKRKLISHSKFYYFDAGVFRLLRGVGPLDPATEIEGVALEGLVAQHLRAWNDYIGALYKIYFWRTRGGLEVDFILYGSKGLWAIEVKNNKNVYEKDLRGLKSFAEDYPEAKLLLLYRGKDVLRKKNVTCLPVEMFLRNLSPELSLSECVEIGN